MKMGTLCTALCLMLAGCGTFFKDLTPQAVPQSIGEAESGYTYVPVDPFPVQAVQADNCKGNAATPLLDALPDNAVRMLVEKFDLSGGVTYGASKAGARGESYRVTVDYINADTINVPVWILKRMRRVKDGDLQAVNLFGASSELYTVGSEIYEISRASDITPPKGAAEFNIPVYVGVGLRVSANVYVVGANANISGIGIIGAEAEAERLRGSLVVQTLGVNGKSIAAALPIQSELNRTTAQNAIVAVGSIKALLYSPETITSPRVVGLYLPFPGGKPLVNALISELSKQRVKWERPCLISAPAQRAPTR